MIARGFNRCLGLPTGFALLLWVLFPSVGASQFRPKEQTKGPELGELVTQRWQAGVIVRAAGGPCTGILATVPLPVDWREQQVTMLEEDFSPGVKVSYQMVEGTVKLMVVEIAHLGFREEAKALITHEVRRHKLLPPKDSASFLWPEKRKLPRDVLPYLGPSPFIESNSPKIQAAARQVISEPPSAWQKVEAIYDWVREKIRYEDGPQKGALAALNDGTGDCEEMTALFIAMCRAVGVPARTVWVPGHAYAEFYLIDGEGDGYWFPCQLSGAREFGGISENRPILQKGDNFRSLVDRRERKRYLAETLRGEGGRPEVEFVRRLLPQ